MLRLLASAVMLLTLPVLTGCALMRTEGTFQYQPQSLLLPMPRGLLSDTRLSGVAVEDARYREDKRILVNKRNGYGQLMSGTWATDRPLSEYTQQAFEAGIKQAGIAERAESPLLLRVAIQSLNDTISERGFRSTRTDLLLAVRVALVRRDTGQEVWREGFVGRSQVHARWLHYGVDDYARSLQTTLNDLVSQVLSAPDFQRALKAGPA